MSWGADRPQGSEKVPPSPMTVEEDRHYELSQPSTLGAILGPVSVCLCLLIPLVVATLIGGVPLVPPLRQVLLCVALPGLPALGIACGVAAIRLGARRWGWIGVVLNGLALLLMAAALAIFLYLTSQIRFTI